MSLIPNIPCPEGIKFGAEIARLTDVAEREHPEMRKRCSSCAFRGGTMPNGCLGTLGDAMKCAFEGDEFRCHERDEPCAGWLLWRKDRSLNIEVPWDFSGGAMSASGRATRNPFVDLTKADAEIARRVAMATLGGIWWTVCNHEGRWSVEEAV